MRIAAYGTLRGGLHSAKYLTDRFGPDSVKVLGEGDLPGFNLFTRPIYMNGGPAPDANRPNAIDCPFAVPGNGTIKITLLEIDDNGAARAIDSGEAWAYDKTLISGFEDTFIYQARDHNDPRYTLVPSGDYLNR